ncbi:hypothetical protein FRB93_000737 [Tulasnella sp. JGI-2019a]|nr:hypothetical protein FRB93_000737 [Tulasnella sp. JGI-2019a]
MPSKKAKKKVTKKVNTGVAPTNAANYADDDDSDGVIPPLEPATMPNRTSRTGLSPDLESVHLSTTASLAAMTNATAEQLGKTAQDLYRGLEKDTMGMGIPEDSDYWLSLPPTIKSFVENAYAQGVFSGTGTEPERAQQMYNVAQQMIANGHLPRMASAGKGSTAPYPPGAYPTFDPAVFSDPAFTQALEQLMPPNGPRFGSAQQGGQNAHGTTTVSGEYIEGFYTGDDDDDVEEDVDVINGRADTITGTHVTVSYDANGVRKMTTTNYSGTVPVPPSAILQVPPDVAAKAKKKQKKQSQNASAATATPAATTPIPKATPTVPVPPTPVTAPPPQRTPISVPVPASALPNVKQAPVQSAKPDLQQAPPLPPPARPAPNPSAPPPSSRAAGKQPMAYPQSAPNATLPPRTARASGKAPATTGAHYHHHPSPPASTKAPPGKPRPPAAPAAAAKKSNDKIWNTSTQEERERIKVFWLGLMEDERQSLVKLEKDAVLKKMKEQQRHSCSCAVCGRKRAAIEAELEVLYGAYYDELRTYANHQQQYASSGGKVSPPPGPGPFPGSVEIDNSGAVVPNALTKHPAPPIPPEEYEDDEDDEDDDYDGEGSEDGSEEEDDDDETEPPYPKGARRPAPPTQNPKIAHHPTGKGVNGNGHPTKRGAVAVGAAGPQQDFFTFGPGLTAAGNILTVADDLLKNDGQKFLEMMEQLAERRMLREEAAAEAIMSEEDSDDEDDSEDESGSEEDEDDEEDEMTEEQKIEEGRRMFSIFAARMFEQRVLHAYRERVAQDRQNQLLRELEEEDKAAADREAKRQKENQKKKDKKRAQKEAKDEAAARRAAERASEEAAAKEKKRAEEEEARKIREEERARKEAEKKAKEEERMLKDMERRKRLAEEKEREKEREAERKKKEKEERERQREEKERLRKEREEKERIEKERQKKLDEEKAAAEALRLKEEAAKRAQEEKERLAREAQEAVAKKAAEEKELAEKAAAATAAAAAAAAIAARNQPKINGVGKKSVPKPAVAGPSNSIGPPNGHGMMRPGPPLSIPAPHPHRPMQPQGPPMGPSQRRPTLPNGLQQPMQSAMGSNSHAPFPQGPPGMGYGPPSPIAPMNFSAGPSQYAMQGPPLTQQGLPVLQPSPLPRGYGQNSMGHGPGPGPIQGDYHPPVQQPQHSPYQSVPPPIGPPLHRGIPSPAPLQQLMSASSVGPNSASQQFSPGPPLSNHSAHSRRSSLDPGPIGGRPTNPPHYGAITRPSIPIAPIGTRPSGGSIPGPSSASSSLAPGGPISSGGASVSSSKMDGDDALSRVSGELTGSPERLGSSALVDPEDEALPSAGGRRVGIMGSVWGHPGLDSSKPNADGRFGSGPWSAFNPPGQNSAQQLTSPMSATPWSMNSSAASTGNWPSSGAGQIGRGQVPFHGLPPPNIGIGAGLSGSGGPIGAPFLQGNFGFSPGGFGGGGPQPPPRQADSPATQ